MSEVILKVDHLKKYFPVKAKMFSGSKGTVHAVDDVSFEIRKGETFGLVGESGCGKSTLSRTILNLVPADGGTIIFNGEDITNLKGKKMEKIRRKMRMIFQKPYGSLNPREKVKEIIGAPLKIHHTVPESGLEDEVLRLMDMVGLNREWLNRYPHEFSGGQRQRIGIARALAGNPSLILADEPTGALDSKTSRDVLNFLKQINEEGNTIVMITHDNSIAVEAKRVIRIADGHKIFDGDVKDYAAIL